MLEHTLLCIRGGSAKVFGSYTCELNNIRLLSASLGRSSPIDRASNQYTERVEMDAWKEEGKDQ